MSDDTRHGSDDQRPGPSMVEVTDPGELIAAIPHLLGFYPTNSIVVLVVKDNRVDYVMRTDCPTDRARYPSVASRLAQQVDEPAGAHTIIVVVGTPERDYLLAGHLRDAFTTAGTTVILFGVPEISRGAPWIDYDHRSELEGTLPDPEASVFAVHTVMKGLVTLPDREDLAARITPAPEDVLARRAALLDATRDNQDPRPTTDDGVDLIRRYTQRVLDGDDHFSDEDIVLACRALTTPGVRKACLVPPGPHPVAEEKLWSILTRQCPAPASAEAATLLAISAYSRGDGTFARIALDRALDLNPQHRLAQLLLDALDAGMRPQHMRESIISAHSWAL